MGLLLFLGVCVLDCCFIWCCLCDLLRFFLVICILLRTWLYGFLWLYYFIDDSNGVQSVANDCFFNISVYKTFRVGFCSN